MPNLNYNPDEFWIAIGDKQAIQRDKERRALAEELKSFAKIRNLTDQPPMPEFEEVKGDA